MHGVTFLQDLAVVMLVAGIVSLLFHRFRQPMVLGYILAGLLIGPHTPPYSFVSDPDAIRTLAELGMVFIMFSLGLDFNLRKLRQVGAPALVVSLCELTVMFWLGYTLGGLFGWRPMDRIFLGAILCISSTMIIVKTLRDAAQHNEKFGQIILGTLIAEDVFAILVMVLLTGLAQTGSLPAGEVALVLGKLFIFVVAAIIVGLLLVPKLIGVVARYRSDETLLVTVLGLCFGVSLLAAKLQYSVALGAFIIGAILAESREIGRIERLTAPIRDMFSAVFFVAIGLQLDPAQIARHPVPVLVITVVFVVGKLVACSTGAFLTGQDGRTCLRVGTGMAQVGEFSLVIAALGMVLGVTGDYLYPVTVAVAGLNTLIRPVLVSRSDAMAGGLGRVIPAPVRTAFDHYRSWLKRLGQARSSQPAMKFVWSLVWQIVLNLALVAGVFITAAFVAELNPAWLDVLPRITGGVGTVCWAGAVLLCLPLFIVTVRKWQALCMLLGELAVLDLANKATRQGIEFMLRNGLFVAGCAGLCIFTVLLSSTLLPPWHTLLALLLLLVVVLALFGRALNRWYSQAKFSLVDLFAQPPPMEPAAPRPMPPLLRDADMETFTMPAGSVEGLRIGELRLRTRTGASIVAIERGGQSQVNPALDEELRAGDGILLLGTTQQIEAAKRVLTDPGSDI
jgi:CPA2 family monovalent cation:H+ antiporter-2